MGRQVAQVSARVCRSARSLDAHRDRGDSALSLHDGRHAVFASSIGTARLRLTTGSQEAGSSSSVASHLQSPLVGKERVIVLLHISLGRAHEARFGVQVVCSVHRRLRPKRHLPVPVASRQLERGVDQSPPYARVSVLWQDCQQLHLGFAIFRHPTRRRSRCHENHRASERLVGEVAGEKELPPSADSGGGSDRSEARLMPSTA
jgi:hypothetical protein